MTRKNFQAAGAAAVLMFIWIGDSNAEEGTSSNYFPGSYGDFLMATAPDPGWV